MIPGGEDSKNLTAKKQTIKQPGGSSARASLFWAEFLRLLLFETVAQVLQRSQANNKRLRGGGREKAANRDPVSLRKFFHVCPKSPMLAGGVTVETHSHLYLMKYYGSCRPVARGPVIHGSHAPFQDHQLHRRHTARHRQNNDRLLRFLYRICGICC